LSKKKEGKSSGGDRKRRNGGWGKFRGKRRSDKKKTHGGGKEERQTQNGRKPRKGDIRPVRNVVNNVYENKLRFEIATAEEEEAQG